MQPKILFMGSSDYSEQILLSLTRSYKVEVVVTQPDKPSGRGKEIRSSIVKSCAENLGIAVFQPKKLDEEFISHLHDNAIDLIIVAAYGKILPKSILDLPKYGCINVHASLLPKWRGASPIQAAIQNGDDRTGISIIKMDEGIDTGPILAQESIRINKDETSESLSKKLSLVGSDLLLRVLPLYLKGNIIPKHQSEKGSTYAGLIKKSDGLLDFNNSADLIERKIRAFYPWPICFMVWDNKHLRILGSKISHSRKYSHSQRGVCDGYPCVGTTTTDLILLEVQPPGKNRMDGKSFLNGVRNWEN